VQVSVTISGFTRLFANDLRAVVEAARVADGAGVHQLVIPDHVVMGTRTDRYPFGRFPYGPEEPWPEPLIVLAAIAAATERIRLATGILISPLRPAVLLAKTAATLDQVSHGRLDLGVGIGWQREEYRAEGIPFADRRLRFADQLRACVALWTREPPVSFESSTVAFTDLWCEPRPVRPDGVPLAFGTAATPEMVDLMAELGAGWLPIHTTTPEELLDGLDRLRNAYRTAGRDPAALTVRETLRPVIDERGRLDGPATLAAAQPLAARGITMASVGLGRNLDDAGGVARFFEDLGRAFAAS
jgi:probable F420-dependent oxidoreductase